LCARSSSSTLSSSLSASRSAAASSGSLAMCQIVRVHLFASSSTTSSLAVSFFLFVYSDNCGLHQHLLPRHFAHATIMEAFSVGASPSTVFPLWLRGDVRVYLVVVDIRIVDYISPGCLASQVLYSHIYRSRPQYNAINP
jgi:hypothetical protein